MPARLGKHKASKRFDHGQPIRFIPLLPIGSVLLVAATLIALSYPPRTHALTFELYPSDYQHPDDFFEPANLVDLDRDGELRWNGTPVTKDKFAEYLAQTLSQPVEPALIFRPDDHASYLGVVQILSIVKRSGIGKLCVSGLARNRRFESATPYLARTGRDNSAYSDCDIWQAQPPSWMY